MWSLLIGLLAIFIYCFTSPFYQQVNTVSYSPEIPEKLTGALLPNDLLDRTLRLHENNLHWPESFAEYNGQLYTGLGDGQIVEIKDTKIIPICRIGQSCEGQHEEHICGRPLGMAFNKAGRLFVADAYLGLFSVDVKTGKKTLLLPSSRMVNGLPLTFLNSLTFDEAEESIYITQSSTRWNISSVIVSIFEHESSGRLLKYDLKTKKVSVLLRDLTFANGVTLSHDNDALLVVEGMNNKILKYYIRGPKKGTYKDFVTNLPGEPDNIKRSPRGTYWTSVATVHSQESPSLLDRLSDKPFLRSLILHTHRSLTAPFCAILNLLPYKEAKAFSFELRHFRFVADHIISSQMIMELNNDGTILRSLQSTPAAKVSHISEVYEFNGHLYLGSWRNHYIGKIKA